ncbi:OsmC family peroxiredoxin [Hymenobacter sp. UV11]|uniref:OsmC family protein n=1 Tax=Hymenobacter sp. UV11 TaxID=1849735 RepID=UPI00106147A8|nr:OsmC family protein [Hymenobacter sp. UV11]TDN36674.1 osmotically inducible protein OsmC [Hymenobacter sp. UV11]TFZ66178.1 OsmC family peroxiredoxin [Hymenobacter sp. UV11]
MSTPHTTATARYEGHLRTEATHTASSTVIQTDAPVDNHGRGEAFSPTDLVGTALGTCMLTTMAIVAERHQLDLVGSSFTMEKIMSQEPPRRIAQLNVGLHLPASLSPADRALMERTAHTCPVALSLNPEIQQEVRFVYE